MALLADTINDGKGPQPTLEKIRCLGAIREMIRLARSHVTNGLPQVSPGLRIGCLSLTFSYRYAAAFDLQSKIKNSQTKASMLG